MPRLQLTEKVAYAAGDAASCLFYSSFAQFLLFFYTDVFGITAAAAGTMFLVTRLWDTANDPLMGMIADRTESRHGKFRPWLRWSLLPLMVVAVLTFTTPDIGPTGKLIWAYITYTLAGMAYTAINVPYSALMGVMTSNSIDRTMLSSFRFLGANAGSLIVQASLLWLVATLGQGNEQRGFQLAMTVLALLAGVLFMFTFAKTRERVRPPTMEHPSWRQDVKDLGRNGPWLIMCSVGVLTLIWISVRNGAIVYYFKYYMGDQNLASSFLVAGSIASILGVACTKYATQLFRSKKRAYIGISLINAVLLTAFYFVAPEKTWLLYGLQVGGSFLCAPLMPLTWAMFADTADYAHYTFGRRSTGLIFSAGTFSQKLGWTIGGAAAGWALALIGFQANVEQVPETLRGIVWLMSFIPAGLSVLTAAGVFFYKIDLKLEHEMEAALRNSSATT